MTDHAPTPRQIIRASLEPSWLDRMTDAHPRLVLACVAIVVGVAFGAAIGLALLAGVWG